MPRFIDIEGELGKKDMGWWMKQNRESGGGGVIVWFYGKVMENTCGISRARSGDRECSWQGKDQVLKAQALGFIASSSTIQEILTLGCLCSSLSKDGMVFLYCILLRVMKRNDMEICHWP